MKNSKEIYSWLRANLGKTATGGLTSTDAHALVASVALANLISYDTAPPQLFEAYRSIVLEMQPHNRRLAYHAIACELDWGHRRMIWTQAGLEDQSPQGRCQFES